MESEWDQLQPSQDAPPDDASTLWAWLPQPKDSPALVRNLDTEPPELYSWLQGRSRPRRVPAKRKAIEAAIERERAAYVHLVCSHVTTREEIEAYSVWAPDHPGLLLCTICGIWVPPLPPRKPEPIPDEPPF